MGNNYGLAATLIAGLAISVLLTPVTTLAGEEPLLTSRLVMQVDAGQGQPKQIVLENGDPVFHGDRLSLQLTAHADLTLSVIYEPSDGPPRSVVTSLALGKGESKVLPGPNQEYEMSGGAGLERFRVTADSAHGDPAKSYARKLVTVTSGGVFDWLDPVLEWYSFDELGEVA